MESRVSKKHQNTQSFPNHGVSSRARGWVMRSCAGTSESRIPCAKDVGATVLGWEAPSFAAASADCCVLPSIGNYPTLVLLLTNPRYCGAGRLPHQPAARGLPRGLLLASSCAKPLGSIGGSFGGFGEPPLAVGVPWI